jgi:DNA repair protein RadC
MENQLDLFNVTEIDLIYRNPVKAKNRPKIKSSQDAYELLKSVWDINKIELVEQFKLVLLNTAGACLGISEIGLGGMRGVVADPRVIFSIALKAGATSLMLAHNHPSGGLHPSAADQSLTQKMKGAGDFLDIRVLDHLIVTPDSYFSFADNGLMP